MVANSIRPPGTGNEAGALAEALSRALSDEALRGRLVALGAERVRLFTWDKAARELLATYERLSGVRPPLESKV